MNFSAASGPAPVQGAPFNPLIAPAPAPQLLYAQLGADLASIQIAFDISTDQVIKQPTCSLMVQVSFRGLPALPVIQSFQCNMCWLAASETQGL